MDSSGPRWKTKGFADIANLNPMSTIILQLQACLSRSKATALLSGCNALLDAGPEISDLLNRTAFGRQLITSTKDKQWFQLGPEEAFYLSHSLKCLRFSGSRDEKPMSELQLWAYFRSQNEAFPELYRAYLHLRSKNWVVRPGTQYGGDFVAYRHHPALVHSEYAVLVVRETEENGRLRAWSDLHCALRACGSVAKTLLVLSIEGNSRDALDRLEELGVRELSISRWIPERCRDDCESGEADRFQ